MIPVTSRFDIPTQAQRQAPSIIFLDELDGLVPARSARHTESDQIYASVVSTLLALMDGLVDRGQVIVIGATNRYSSKAHTSHDSGSLLQPCLQTSQRSPLVPVVPQCLNYCSNNIASHDT